MSITPEQAARFIRSDCQDPELRRIADAEADASLAEAMKDPAFKARWDADIRAMADTISVEILAKVYRDIYNK